VRDAQWPNELLFEIDALIADLEIMKEKIIKEEKRRRRKRETMDEDPP
jgi:hypothetical protein